jgi:hypothetical protein
MWKHISNYPKPNQQDCEKSESKTSESILNFVSVAYQRVGMTARLRKRKMTKFKLLFMNGLYKKGQLGQPISGSVLYKKPLIFNHHWLGGGGCSADTKN